MSSVHYIEEDQDLEGAHNDGFSSVHSTVVGSVARWLFIGWSAVAWCVGSYLIASFLFNSL
jgi:hypothetical protein